MRSLRTYAAITLFALSTAAFANPIVAGFNSNTLPANDDGSAPITSLGFNINFFGNTYANTFVNNNGNLTFTSPLSTYTPFGLGASSQAIIAPFFADVDTRGVGSGLVTYGTGTYNGLAAFGANYLNVGYYQSHTDLRDNFQVLLVSRNDIALGDFDIYFNYGTMQWETGDASSGSGGRGGSCAGSGYSNGTIAGANQTTYQLPGSQTCGALIDGGVNALSTHTNDGVTGQYLFQARSGTVIPMSMTPEPSSIMMLGTGLLTVAGAVRRRIAAR